MPASLESLERKVDDLGHKFSVQQGKMRAWHGSLTRFVEQVNNGDKLFTTIFVTNASELESHEKNGFTFVGYMPLPGKSPLLIMHKRRH